MPILISSILDDATEFVTIGYLESKIKQDTAPVSSENVFNKTCNTFDSKIQSSSHR